MRTVTVVFSALEENAMTGPVRNDHLREALACWLTARLSA